jgi:hypothetical protein
VLKLLRIISQFYFKSENYASEAIAHRWGKQLGKIPRSFEVSRLSEPMDL